LWDDLPAGSERPVVFIERNWLNVKHAKDNAQSNQTLPEKERLAKVRSSRAALVSELGAAGFPIVHDDKALPQGAIYLTPYDFIKDAETAAKWRAEKDQKAVGCCGEAISRPASVPFDGYVRNPFFPAVLKSDRLDRGMDKFFIKTPGQFELIQRFHAEVLPKIPPYFQIYFNECLFQQYIEPPAGLHSSLRVLASASGDVIAVGLIHNSALSVPRRKEQGFLDKFFSDPESPYFLNCESILSNRAAGGSIIAFGAPKYSDDKRRVLQAHGFDPANLSLPIYVEQTAKKIAKICNRELGIISGLDFIYHAKEALWYFLEANHNPSMGTYALTKGKKIASERVSEFELDLEVRREALRMCVLKSGTT
jgi:hypothetical protein